MLLDTGGEDVELPYEFLQIARLISKRTGQTVEEVMSEWLNRVVGDAMRDPERAEQALAARVRYCEAEGLDTDEFTFRSCQATLRRTLKELRQEMKGS